MYAVVFQDPLVVRRVELVSGESVELPYEQDFKLLASALPNQPLTIRTVICLRGQRAVNVDLDDVDTVLFGERLSFSSHLLLCGLIHS